MEDGKALKIVNIDNHKFELDEKLLASVLNRPEIKNRKIVVISIAGAFRKGKSFLLGFFLRYLNAQYVRKDATNWMENGGDVLEGFSWKNGCTRDTTGILMWSQIFLHNKGKEKIAIMLLDTQGVFDNQSTMRDCSFIFALSTLISSVQIYNISSNLQENDLQHLQLFTEYGKMALEKSAFKPFQKLQFLIRDWACAYNYKYGAEGGKAMLDNYLKISENQHKELKGVREHIKSCFYEIECFLMPHPGLKVCTKQDFTGQLDLIENDFKLHLNDLIVSLLAPENLRIKVMNGQQILAGELITYWKSYVHALASDEIVKPVTMMRATAEASHTIAMSQAQELYISDMKKIVDSPNCLSYKDFNLKDAQIRTKCIKLFDSRKKMGDFRITQKFRQRLLKEFNDLVSIYKQGNDNKLESSRIKSREIYLRAKKYALEHYENEMNKLFVGNGFMEDTKLEELHRKNRNASWGKFKSRKIPDGDDVFFKECQDQLYKENNASYLRYKKTNADNRENAEKADQAALLQSIHELKDLYSMGMDNFCSGVRYRNDKELYERHFFLKEDALRKFREIVKNNRNDVSFHYDKLQQDFQKHYNNWINRNKDKKAIYFAEIDAKNITARMNALNFYRNKIENFLNQHKYFIERTKAIETHILSKMAAMAKFENEANRTSPNYTQNVIELEEEINAASDHYIKARRDSSWSCTIS
ncbi:ATL2.2 family protein [Megaselia abdita]